MLGNKRRGTKGFMPNTPTILVTDTSRGSSIAIIRSLGRKGWRVIAADSCSNSLGFYSQYASANLVYPPPDSAPDEFFDALLDVAQVQSVDLVIPVTDEVILPLSADRARFKGVSKLALPGQRTLELVTNKCKTLDLAQRLKVPCPKTFVIHSVEEACKQAPELGWPLVLKPQFSRLYRNQHGIEKFSVSYAQDVDDLAVQVSHLEGRCPVLLQEYYSGIGEGVELLMCQGEPIAGFQHRRLREFPLHGGPSAFRESVDVDPEMWEYAVSMLREMNWTGLAMVEFKTGSDGPKLMEINGRVWGSLPLAVLSGMDFPAKLVDMYLSGPPEMKNGPDLSYVRGVRARNVQLDILWIASVLGGINKYPFFEMPKRGQGIKALLELFNPAYKDDILSLEDPRPGLVQIPRVFENLYDKVSKVLRGA
jgi:predicted ATP-grasp superfamily ATP-dependent carboligase